MNGLYFPVSKLSAVEHMPFRQQNNTMCDVSDTVPLDIPVGKIPFLIPLQALTHPPPTHPLKQTSSNSDPFPSLPHININKTVNKADRMLGFLRHNLKISSSSTKEKSYKAFVRPLLEYAWDPYT